MTYKLYKIGNKRCTKVFESIDEAKSYAFAHDGQYYIVYKYEDENEPRHMYF